MFENVLGVRGAEAIGCASAVHLGAREWVVCTSDVVDGVAIRMAKCPVVNNDGCTVFGAIIVVSIISDAIIGVQANETGAEQLLQKYYNVGIATT